MNRETKKLVTKYGIIGVVSVTVFVMMITLLVMKVRDIFGEKPVQISEEPTKVLTPTPTPEPWDPEGVAEIRQIVATSQILSLICEKVKGAAGYEISYRSEEGEWQQVISKDTKCQIPIHSGFTYHVKVRSVSPDGQKGPISQEGIVSAEAVRPVVTVKECNSYSATYTWPYTREGAHYIFRFKPSEETEWQEYESDVPEISVGGLLKGKKYDVMVSALKEDFATLSSDILTMTPEGTGYGDPFFRVHCRLKVGVNSKEVSYTAENGCLGINCWAQFKTPLCNDVALTDPQCDLAGGTAMVISKDADGKYVCEREGNRYSIHVTATVSGEKKEGWVLGNALFVDLAMIYPMSNKYSIQYNRTNAYASIFTCGGNAAEVDTESEEETRYDPLLAKDGKESLETPGYNEIKEVTGEILPNYGPKDQMPAVWDVALQLLAAQRDALGNGYCLLIYEAYRPNATSKKVYSAMTGNAYFKEEIENENLEKKLTLANGFLNKNYTEAYFIANNSNHNKGIAVDLTIMKYDSTDKLGEEVKMQTKMHTLDYRCDMTYNGKEAKLLYEIMTKNTKLVPLVAKQEWWHFQLNSDVDSFPCFKDYVFANYKI